MHGKLKKVLRDTDEKCGCISLFGVIAFLQLLGAALVVVCVNHKGSTLQVLFNSLLISHKI